MLYWYGCSIRKLTVWPFRLSFGTRTSDYLITWASFYWQVAQTLRDIVIIIRYIFGQLFFMPCGVTCQAWSKEVPINDGTWRFRYSLCDVYIEAYREIFCGSYNFRDIFYRESYNETLGIISYLSVYVVLLHCNISFY